MAGPLDGVRVVEVANWLAAPGAAAMMADMGADVIKIEPPQGDFYRGYMMASRGDGDTNFNFELENRGKRSIAIDLGAPRAAELVLRLCAEADVFITNLVRERFERYGLTFEAVRAASPRIIYTAVSGYGSSGALADKAGFDASAFWASSGIMSVMGDEGGQPVVSRGGQGDHPTALAALAAILAALRQRDQTGEAQFVDVTLQRAGVWTLASDVQQSLAGLEARPRQDRLTQGMVTWNPYRTRDGRWLMLVMNDPPRYWNRFARCIEREDLVDDERYTTTPQILRHGPALIPELDAIFATRDLDAWVERLEAHGCLFAVVATVDEVIADEQLRGQGAFNRVTREDGKTYEVVATPFSIAGADIHARGVAPTVGQHSAAILEELGLTPDEIAAFGAAGAFG
ncbi:MAG: CoA transferase [Dehalococcoidia bacterium]